jgi:hypothetical protein
MTAARHGRDALVTQRRARPSWPVRCVTETRRRLVHGVAATACAASRARTGSCSPAEIIAHRVDETALLAIGGCAIAAAGGHGADQPNRPVM